MGKPAVKLSHIVVAESRQSDRPATWTPADAGPGWYYDPYDRAVFRFWDGTGWTERQSDRYPARRRTSA